MTEKDGQTEGSSNSSSHDDRQDEHQDFVKHLLKKTARLQLRDLDPDFQLELALLIDLLSRNRRGFVYTHKVYFEAALEMAAAEKPKLVLLQRLLSNLQVAEEQQEGGLTGLIIKICGSRPATAMMAGLISIFVALCLTLVLLVVGHTLLSRLEQAIDSIHLAAAGQGSHRPHHHPRILVVSRQRRQRRHANRHHNQSNILSPAVNLYECPVSAADFPGIRAFHLCRIANRIDILSGLESGRSQRPRHPLGRRIPGRVQRTFLERFYFGNRNQNGHVNRN